MNMPTLNIAYLYADDLNLYGDTGNVEILYYRAKQRGFNVDVTMVDSKGTPDFSRFNLLFMGGGPDSGQKEMYGDLIRNKGPRLRDYINNDGVGLFICGSYQLLGHYYRSRSGSVAGGGTVDIEGVGALDLYTEHFGHQSKRCVGNLVCRLDPVITKNEWFEKVNHFGEPTLVGFENHGGQTFLNEGLKPFAHVLKGFGNNMNDKTEGVVFKNTIGSYMHGPILSKNPHIADFLIASALKITELKPLPIDVIISNAHTALVKRFK